MDDSQPQRSLSNPSNPDPLSQFMDASALPTIDYSSLKHTDSNDSKGDAPQRSSAPTAQLSCELCRQRKVKCDKGNPCSTCQRAGVKCFPIKRQRLPRGRNGGRRIADAELKARVGRLENLVRSLEPNADLEAIAQPAVKEEDASVEDQATHTEYPIGGLGHSVPPPVDSKTAASRYVGSTFWQSISEEVSGIREVLEEESDDELETTTSDSSTGLPTNASNFNFVLCGPNSFMMSPDVLKHPSHKMRVELCNIYFYQADPLFKILHRPTLVAHFFENKPYLNYPPGHPSIEALSFAIYFAALMSQTEEQCVAKFGENFSTLTARYKFATEVSLARAGLLTTTDITVVQALVLYLLANRLHDSSRVGWTLFAVAYRIARAIGIHLEDPYFLNKPFERELRRRLWYAINLLDTQGSIDRGAEPMILIDTWSTHLPMNINDEDIWPGQVENPEERQTFTDMTFSLMSWNASSLGKRLNFIPPRNQGAAEPEIARNWKLRSEYVDQFQQRVRVYLKHVDMNNPLHVQAIKISQCMVAAMRLIVVRPLNRESSQGPPKVPGAKLLDLACEVLSKSAVLRTLDDGTAPFRWLEGLFIHWHALAVALAELCHHTQGPQVDRAWILVENAYERYSKNIADSSEGMLWKPITKLLKKARSRREAALSSQNAGMLQDLSIAQEQKAAQAPLSPPTSLSPPAVDFALGAPDAFAPPPPTQQQQQQQQRGSYSSEMGGSLSVDAWANGTSMSAFMGSGGSSGSGGSDTQMQDSPGVGWDNWEDFVSDLRFDDADVLYGGVNPETLGPGAAAAASAPAGGEMPPLWNSSVTIPGADGWNFTYGVPWK